MKMHAAVAKFYNELTQAQHLDVALLEHLVEFHPADDAEPNVRARIATRGRMMDRVTCCLVLANALGTARPEPPS